MATSRSTRNTPRVQTCAAPSLRPRNNKAWRESINHFLFNSYSEYSSSRWFLMLQKKEKKKRSQKINPVFKVFNASPPQFFQVVPYVIADISWKFHENLFVYLSIILLTDTPPRLDGKPWNSLVRRETVYLFFVSCPIYHEKINENPFISFSLIVLTITDLQNRKIDPEFKGLITTTQKCSRFFFVVCAIFPENFMKIRSSVFP